MQLVEEENRSTLSDSSALLFPSARLSTRKVRGAGRWRLRCVSSPPVCVSPSGQERERESEVGNVPEMPLPRLRPLCLTEITLSLLFLQGLEGGDEEELACRGGWAACCRCSSSEKVKRFSPGAAVLQALWAKRRWIGATMLQESEKSTWRQFYSQFLHFACLGF